MNKLTRSLLASAVLATMVIAAFATGCGKAKETASTQEAPQPIELKAVLPGPANVSYVKFSLEFFEEVNKRSNGRLVIKHLGGPEVIPVDKLAEGLRGGSVDVAHLFTGLYEDKLPEAGVFPISELTPMEERKSGFYDLMVQLHKEKMNAYYLGRPRSVAAYITATKFPVKNPRQDFKGKKIASASQLYVSFIKSLGAVPVTLPEAETYSALERGLVDAVVTSTSIVKGYSLFEVTKYQIDHPFFPAANSVLLVNKDVWDKLPKDLQDLMNTVMMETEQEMVAFFAQQIKDENQLSRDKGLQFVSFSPEDAKWYTDMAHESTWQKVKEKVSPEMYAKLREALKKN